LQRSGLQELCIQIYQNLQVRHFNIFLFLWHFAFICSRAATHMAKIEGGDTLTHLFTSFSHLQNVLGRWMFEERGEAKQSSRGSEPTP
jgi:hypothetical protein